MGGVHGGAVGMGAQGRCIEGARGERVAWVLHMGDLVMEGVIKHGRGGTVRSAVRKGCIEGMFYGVQRYMGRPVEVGGHGGWCCYPPLCTCETLCGRPSGMSFIWVAIKRGACNAG